MTTIQIAYWLWVGFVISWNIASLWTAKARSRGGIGLSLAYFGGYVAGFGLLFTQHLPGGMRFGFAGVVPPGWLIPAWQTTMSTGWILLLAEGAAFGFAWWARLHLGTLWSGMLTLRDGHRVVDSGPYRLVRHPIYTGFIGASWALALLVATPAALIGAAILTVVMTTKARAEERLLRRELGIAAYDDYARRTPMLVPFAPR